MYMARVFATIVHKGGDNHKYANYRFDRNDDGGDDLKNHYEDDY